MRTIFYKISASLRIKTTGNDYVTTKIDLFSIISFILCKSCNRWNSTLVIVALSNRWWYKAYPQNEKYFGRCGWSWGMTWQVTLCLDSIYISHCGDKLFRSTLHVKIYMSMPSISCYPGRSRWSLSVIILKKRVTISEIFNIFDVTLVGAWSLKYKHYLHSLP